jgi:hypothetical protein
LPLSSSSFDLDSDVSSPSTTLPNKWVTVGIVAAVIAAVGYGGYALIGKSPTSENVAVQSGDVAVNSDGKLKLFDKYNRYVLEDFDAKPTFSDFLPGVAGYFGKPVWSF